MKKRLLIMSFVALFATEGMRAEDEATAQVAIPYEEIINVLQDSTVLDLAGQVGGRRVLEGLGSSLRGMQTLDADIKAAAAVAKNFKYRLSCAKLPKQLSATLARDNFDIGKALDKNGPSVKCKDVGCGANKAACTKAAIQDLKALLKPLVQDMFVGYTDAQGKQQPPLTIALFDVINQPQFADNKDFQKTVNILKIIIQVLDIIDKAIVVNK